MGWAEHPSNLTENDLEVGFEPTTSQLTCASRVSCVCVCVPRLPKKDNPRRALWLENSRRRDASGEGRWDPASKYIYFCSQHFEKSCFEIVGFRWLTRPVTRHLTRGPLLPLAGKPGGLLNGFLLVGAKPGLSLPPPSVEMVCSKYPPPPSPNFPFGGPNSPSASGGSPGFWGLWITLKLPPPRVLEGLFPPPCFFRAHGPSPRLLGYPRDTPPRLWGDPRGMWGLWSTQGLLEDPRPVSPQDFRAPKRPRKAFWGHPPGLLRFPKVFPRAWGHPRTFWGPPRAAKRPENSATFGTSMSFGTPRGH